MPVLTGTSDGPRACLPKMAAGERRLYRIAPVSIDPILGFPAAKAPGWPRSSRRFPAGRV